MKIAIVLTACGIETYSKRFCNIAFLKNIAIAPTACGIMRRRGEAAEEQSDDEIRTSLVPDKRENKGDDGIYLPFTVLKHSLTLC